MQSTNSSLRKVLKVNSQNLTLNYACAYELRVMTDKVLILMLAVLFCESEEIHTAEKRVV